MVSVIISRVVILVFGTLYPAYASYKAVKTKNVKEYVKWMMYWIVFAFFTCAETFSDIFLAWLPFYYELKIVFVIWLLSPATKGSSILYRKFVHPQLAKREKEIDQYINKASDQGYSAILSLGSKGFNYATNVVLATAIKGQSKIVDQLRKSYSMNDLTPVGLSQPPRKRTASSQDSDDDEIDNRILEERYRSEMDLRARENIPEEDEEDSQDTVYQEREVIDLTSSKHQKNQKTQKEVPHYATLPKARTRTSKRASVKDVF